MMEVEMSLAGIDELLNLEVRYRLGRGITLACKYLGMRVEVIDEYLSMSIKDQYKIFYELFSLVKEKYAREITSAWLERWRKP